MTYIQSNIPPSQIVPWPLTPTTDEIVKAMIHEHLTGEKSVRERAAIAAMQGLCAGLEASGWTYEQMAQRAVAYADALLAELNKEKP